MFPARQRLGAPGGVGTPKVPTLSARRASRRSSVLGTFCEKGPWKEGVSPSVARQGVIRHHLR